MIDYSPKLICFLPRTRTLPPRSSPLKSNYAILFASSYCMRILVCWHAKPLRVDCELDLGACAVRSLQCFVFFFHSFRGTRPSFDTRMCLIWKTHTHTFLVGGALAKFWMIDWHRHLIFHKQIFKRLYCVLAAGRPITSVKCVAHNAEWQKHSGRRHSSYLIRIYIYMCVGRYSMSCLVRFGYLQRNRWKAPARKPSSTPISLYGERSAGEK